MDYSSRQARIQVGPRGPCPPPPPPHTHTKLLPQIVRRGSRGGKRALITQSPPPPPGGQEGLVPPPPPLQNPGSAYGRPWGVGYQDLIACDTHGRTNQFKGRSST